MSKYFRHLKIKNYRGVNGLVVLFIWNWSYAWCNRECDDCKSRFKCYTLPKDDALVIDSYHLDKVSIDRDK